MPDSVDVLSPLAGKPAPRDILVDVSKLVYEYYARFPDPSDPAQRVSFGTSGHRGSSLNGSFNEGHILAIAQAIAEYRKGAGIDGPLYMGKDTHALSDPAQRSALEVLAANGVNVLVAHDDAVTPTPVVSHAILTYNRERTNAPADGIVITPSHNPPEDGGFKYDPPHGGPAEESTTRWIGDRANELLRDHNAGVARFTYERAITAATTGHHDFMIPYVRDLEHVIDIDAIRGSGLRVGVDPCGGASVNYWPAINAVYGLDLELISNTVDPTFAFMTVDHDGKIRTDPSSPYAMGRLIEFSDQYDIAFANDADADRHGIVTRTAGLLNPNHYLAVAIRYLLGHREHWAKTSAVGKTVVSSGMIDRVVKQLGRHLSEVPVGFKWFVDGLLDGSYCFGGEESAGASFLRRNGHVWTTDKDGLIMGLLAAEITANTGKDPGQHYRDLEAMFGTSYYTRIDAPATPEQKAALSKLRPNAVRTTQLAGEAIVSRITAAPGNGAAIGGLKVEASNGWFAARPSGTENIYKIYAESFTSKAHLDAIVSEAQTIVGEALAAPVTVPS